MRYESILMRELEKIIVGFAKWPSESTVIGNIFRIAEFVH
jgi:hypothetical protein